MASLFVAPLFDSFWRTPEVNLCPKRQKLPISLKSTPKSKKFAQRYNV